MKKKIESITIRKMFDESPDLSYIGAWTDSLEEGVIVRKFDKFYEDLTEEELERLPEKGREYRAFKPEVGGEKVGSPDYKTYGFQDYELMQKIQDGLITFIGVKAVAKCSLEISKGNYRTITEESGGLWGIEYDYKDNSYIEEIAEEEYAQLKSILITLGFKKIPAFSADMIEEDIK